MSSRLTAPYPKTLMAYWEPFDRIRNEIDRLLVTDPASPFLRRRIDDARNLIRTNVRLKKITRAEAETLTMHLEATRAALSNIRREVSV